MSEQAKPDFLYAPWRMDYISNTTSEPVLGCIFCEKPSETFDSQNLILYRGQMCFVILNAFPYNSGHLMIIPYQHTANLAELPPETCMEMIQLARFAMAALQQVMHPEGYNLGMNLGHIAGAGIAEHLHLHIVPRWAGDVNFMTVIGNTRVVPEALEQTWKKMRDALAAVIASTACPTVADTDNSLSQ